MWGKWTKWDPPKGEEILVAAKPVLSRRPQNGEDSKWPHSALKPEKGWRHSFLFFAVACMHFFFLDVGRV